MVLYKDLLQPNEDDTEVENVMEESIDAERTEQAEAIKEGSLEHADGQDG